MMDLQCTWSQESEYTIFNVFHPMRLEAESVRYRTLVDCRYIGAQANPYSEAL